MCQRALAAIALVACSPLMLCVTGAILVDSRGPVLFRQLRPGRRERLFVTLKFRSMRSGSERGSRLGVSASDARITCVGRVIRATKVDELPQLWNVVRGEMLLVGPRPIPIALDAVLREAIPGFEERYAVKPGLTSLSQVCIADNGLGDQLVGDWNRRFEAERRYMEKRCVSYDVAILLLTVLYVARKVVRR